MNMIEGMLAEFDHEATNTVKLLERVPEDKLEWQPHQKSMTLARLAGHLAEIPGWGKIMLNQDVFDLDSMADYKPVVPTDRKQLLQLFEDNLGGFREAAAGISDQAMASAWRMVKGEQQMLEMPRVAAVRGMVLNHIVHHRGQLSVYLRLLEAPVPAVYGPSADEQGGF